MAIVTTSTNSGAVTGANQNAIIHFPGNGVDLLFYIDNNSDLACRYSTSGGATWITPLSGAIAVTGTVLSFSVKLDAADVMHGSYKDGATHDIHYFRGVPDTARTSYTWNAPVVIELGTVDNRLFDPDIFPVKIGASVHLHFIFSLRKFVSGSTEPDGGAVVYKRYTTPDVGGAVTLAAAFNLETDSVSPNSYSGTIVVDGANDVHIAYGESPSWKYARLPFGDGTWPSAGLIKEIAMASGSGSVPQLSMSPAGIPYICGVHPTGNVVKVANKETGAWVDVSPAGVTGTRAQGFFEGNAYRLCYVSSGLKMRRYTSVWDPEIVVNPDTTITRLNVERRPTGRIIGAASLSGAASPFTIAYERISLPAQGYNMII